MIDTIADFENSLYEFVTVFLECHSNRKIHTRCQVCDQNMKYTHIYIFIARIEPGSPGARPKRPHLGKKHFFFKFPNYVFLFFFEKKDNSSTICDFFAKFKKLI